MLQSSPHTWGATALESQSTRQRGRELKLVPIRARIPWGNLMHDVNASDKSIAAGRGIDINIGHIEMAVATRPPPRGPFLVDCPNCGHEGLSRQATMCPDCVLDLKQRRRTETFLSGSRFDAPLFALVYLTWSSLVFGSWLAELSANNVSLVSADASACTKGLMLLLSILVWQRAGKVRHDRGHRGG